MSRRKFTFVLLLLISFVLPASSLIHAQAAARGQAPRAPQTAQEFYREYQAAFARATKIDELLPYLAANARAEIEKTPAADRGTMFEFMKMLGVATNVVITKEEKVGDAVILTATGAGPDKTKGEGKIEIVRENNAWKLKGDSWSWK